VRFEFAKNSPQFPVPHSFRYRNAQPGLKFISISMYLYRYMHLFCISINWSPWIECRIRMTGVLTTLDAADVNTTDFYLLSSSSALSVSLISALEFPSAFYLSAEVCKTQRWPLTPFRFTLSPLLLLTYNLLIFYPTLSGFLLKLNLVNSLNWVTIHSWSIAPFQLDFFRT